MKSMKIMKIKKFNEITLKIFLNLYVPILIYKKHRGFSNMRERIFLNHKKKFFTLRGPKKRTSKSYSQTVQLQTQTQKKQKRAFIES